MGRQREHMQPQGVTPLHITIGAHYAVSMVDFENLSVPAVANAIQDFLTAELLREQKEAPGRPRYVKTAGLDLWIEEICKVPFPRIQWIMPWYDKDGEHP